MSDFKRGDLVRVTNEKHREQELFARVWAVKQSWLEFTPGVYGAAKFDCEVVHRPTEKDRTVDYGYIALPEADIERLWRLAEANQDPAAKVLRDELYRIRRLPWRIPPEQMKPAS